MICTGKTLDNHIDNETKFINENNEEIFYGYRNKFAPLKMIITGCGGKYSYIGETLVLDGSQNAYLITENENKLLRINRVKSFIPKCEVVDYKRNLSINLRTNLSLNTLIISLMDGDKQLASMDINRKEYKLEIKDSENPTLMAAIILGAIEICGFGGEQKE